MAPKQVVIEIEAELWLQAKVEAAKRGIPLKQLVAEALEKEIKGR